MFLPLNSTMIAVALPTSSSTSTSLGSTVWLVSGYLIAQASLQPLAGKLGDRHGRRPLLLVGLASFGLVSLGAALAPSLAVLITFRVLQAVAGALVFPNSIALVRELLPEARRGTVFGMLGSAIGLAAAAGPPLGGALVALGGWQAIFLVNLPWVAVAIWLALRSVPAASQPPIGGASISAGRRSGACCSGRPPGSSIPARFGWAVPAAVVTLVVLVVAFVRYELDQDDPILEPRFRASGCSRRRRPPSA